jgi:hypothetical protein
VALSGILSRLLSSGTIIVATSNRAPKDLNEVCSLLVNLFYLIYYHFPCLLNYVAGGW